MFEFKIVGETVQAHVTGSHRTFLFEWNAGSAWAAELLRDDLRRNFNALVKDVRQEEYERGWRDARRKNRKKTWFFFGLSRGNA